MGMKFLSFSTTVKSKFPSRLVSFGRNSNHDVRLPSQPRPLRNYSNDQCYFYLAASGELILRELSPSSIQIVLPDATAEQQQVYSIQGNPPQRVIPKDKTRRAITFEPTNAKFQFQWMIPLQDNKTDADLAKHALDLAIAGMTVTRPVPQTFGPFHQYALRSQFSLPAASRSGSIKSIHRYRRLGEGTCGVVHKAVDLSSGEMWAVKEFKPKARTAEWTASFKREVETLSKLRHVSPRP